MQDFLPVTRKEMKERGWEQADFVYVTGDAYVDHPLSFISFLVTGKKSCIYISSYVYL